MTITVAAMPMKACQCGAIPDAATAKRMSAAVFAGTVSLIEATDLRAADGTVLGAGQAVTFNVTRAWKGVKRSPVVVTVGYTNCDVRFSRGVSYLVYAAYSNERRLSASVCSRTKALGVAANDLAALGISTSVVAANRTSPAGHMIKAGAARVVTVVLIIVVLAATLLRRRSS